MPKVNVFAIKAKDMQFVGLDTVSQPIRLPVESDLVRSRKTYQLAKDIFKAPIYMLASLWACLLALRITFPISIFAGLVAYGLGRHFDVSYPETIGVWVGLLIVLSPASLGVLFLLNSIASLIRHLMSK